MAYMSFDFNTPKSHFFRGVVLALFSLRGNQPRLIRGGPETIFQCRAHNGTAGSCDGREFSYRGLGHAVMGVATQ